jgi:hypothetical protein
MADARIIKLGGVPDVPFDVEDLQSERRFTPMRAYGQAKLALVMSGYELARHLAGSGVTVNALHPGVVATGIADALVPGPLRPVMRLARPFLRLALRTPEEGARSIIHLATAPDLASRTANTCRRTRTPLAGRCPTTGFAGALRQRSTELEFDTARLAVDAARQTRRAQHAKGTS